MRIMMTRKKINSDWLKGLAVVLLLSFSPAVGYADWEDILSQFRPRITVREDYTNNLNLTTTNKIEDYITTVNPGLTLYATDRKEASYGVNLDYMPGFVSFAHNSQDNYVSHLGTLNAWYTFDRKLTIRLSDYFLRSDEPAEAQAGSLTSLGGQTGYVGAQPGVSYLGAQPGYYLGAQPGAYYLGSQSGRFIYYRNTVAPSLTYQFGPENRFDLSYVDDWYNTQNPSGENSRSDSITPRLTYWFNIHNGIILENALTYGHFQVSPDFVEDRTRVRYTYRFTPRISVFGEYIFDAMNYQSSGVQVSGVSSVNAITQTPSIGMTYAFSPTLTGRAQAGYFVQNPAGGPANTGPSFNMGLNQRTERTTYDLALQGGYVYSYFAAANLGFTKTYRAIGTITHRLSSRVFLRGFASLERDEYTDVSDQKAWLWRTNGELSYQILKWLTASLGVTYTQNSSNQNNADYQELRGMIRLTAGSLMGAYPGGAYPGGVLPGSAFPGSFY